MDNYVIYYMQQIAGEEYVLGFFIFQCFCLIVKNRCSEIKMSAQRLFWGFFVLREIKEEQLIYSQINKRGEITR